MKFLILYKYNLMTTDYLILKSFLLSSSSLQSFDMPFKVLKLMKNGMVD